jgi:hypothetical protein
MLTTTTTVHSNYRRGSRFERIVEDSELFAGGVTAPFGEGVSDSAFLACPQPLRFRDIPWGLMCI